MLRILLIPALLVSTAALATPDQDPDARAAAIEAQMTDDERFHLLHSNLPITIEPGKPSSLIPGAPITPGFVTALPRVGTPAILKTDASLGVVNPFELREGDVATAMPSTLALASTFDADLAFRAGATIGNEAKAKGFNVLLGPGVNLARDPRNGRNFEYLGEDPLLAGVLGGEMSRGIQSQGVVATIKHLALNAQETLRRTLDARIDEAALRESDLLAFEIGIERGQPGAVMCAYNQVNGAWACGNDHLLNRVLKGDWGYKGWVMSDWGAVHDVSYFNAGLDQHSGAQLDKKIWLDGPLKEEYAAGRVSKERLADAVKRILRSLFAVGAEKPATTTTIDYAAHAKVARETATNGMVLLKNDGVLPIDTAQAPKSILAIGGYAIAGVLAGGGSSQVTPVGGAAAIIPQDVHRLVKRPTGQLIVPSSPVFALRELLKDTKIDYDTGYDTGLAVARAARADLVIVFATKWQTEGADTTHLSLSGAQDEMIAAVAKANPNVVVVLETGNPVLMPWLSSVKGVVQAWYPGQDGGGAIADILTGRINPSGRLPISFPADESQLVRPQLIGLGEPDSMAAKVMQVPYDEGADVGYRWFAKQSKQPLFAFGHGLSYTRFEHSALKLKGSETVSAQFKVRNIGKRDGADVPQLYLVDAAGTKVKRLVGFARVPLKAGASKALSYDIDPRLLANWDKDGWLIKAGSYGFALGASANELGPAVSITLAQRRLQP